MIEFCPQEFKRQFPFFHENNSNGQSLIYFDNAATTHKPKTVIEHCSEFYQDYNANVHRSSHQLSSVATQKFEQARHLVKRFIGAASEKEIVWTKGTTEGINLIVQTYGRTNIKSGDEILLSVSEHHANIVPWQELAKETGAVIKVMPLESDGRIDTLGVNELICDKTAIVSLAIISNVIGKRNDVDAIIAKAHSVGAIVVLDAAQAIVHERIDVSALDCDFLVFSGHKMYGPTGVGVLFGKQALLEAMPPYQFGGEMIKKVSFSGTSYADLPFKFETGTPNIAGVIGLGAAVEFMQHHGNAMFNYEAELTKYCYQKLAAIDNIQLLFEQMPDIPLFSFTVKRHHNQDIASYLTAHNIAIRAGHHCAMPLMEYLSLPGSLRISLAPYNTKQEIDSVIKCLQDFIAGNASEQKQTKDAILKVEARLAITQSAPEKNPLVNDIIQRLQNARGWDGRHREIMLLSKQLQRMPHSLRTNDNLIQGCESDVWIKANQTADGQWHFQADSDAKVIRGLLVIILSFYQDKTSAQIQQLNIDDYFDQLGLMHHLSPSRGNGVKAIANYIYQQSQGG
ncbi:SufS family cysteine desulfurase [Colwellia sp. MEBiC06753]